jgi:type II secretory pathway component GspD/PulD (secretin)
VLLHIHPTVSDVTDQQKTLRVRGQIDQLPLALSQIRESDSIVKARSGQVIVIGGLMRETRNRQTTRCRCSATCRASAGCFAASATRAPPPSS